MKRCCGILSYMISVLVSADSEWQAVKEIFSHSEINRSPYGEWFGIAQQELGGRGSANPQTRDLLFFHGGWGKIAAAGSTQYVIDRWQPELLINLGTCGGFAGQVERGTTILVEKTIVYDILEQMGDFAAHIQHYTTALDLSWLHPPYPQPVQRTLLVSGDRDLLVAEIPTLHQQYGAVAGDWESGAIAWVAQRNGVRLLILRGVSDLVGPEGGEAYGNLEAFHQAARRIMGKLIEHLPGWIACCQL